MMARSRLGSSNHTPMNPPSTSALEVTRPNSSDIATRSLWALTWWTTTTGNVLTGAARRRPSCSGLAWVRLVVVRGHEAVACSDQFAQHVRIHVRQLVDVK